MDSEAKFVCDDHCGRLARWLRTLGFDCVHDQNITDAHLLTIALEEDRIILTRDRRLAGQALARRLTLLESADPLEQLRQVLREAGATARPDHLFTRCVVCNQPTESAVLAAVADRVPLYVRKTQTAFRQCPACGRVCWRGTHVQRMLERLQSAGIIAP